MDNKIDNAQLLCLGCQVFIQPQLAPHKQQRLPQLLFLYLQVIYGHSSYIMENTSACIEKNYHICTYIHAELHVECLLFSSDFNKNHNR
jgi:hypothetical protein